jgi:hypothetical protein
MILEEVIKPLQHNSKLSRLMLLMSSSFEALGKEVDSLEVERISSIIHQVMSAKYRKYHNLDHVFQMVEGTDAIGVLSAIFHDTVYCQVDKRIHPYIKPFLEDFTVDEKYQCALPDLEQDECLEYCGRVFGFKSGQVLGPFTGLNEFLSAVSAARILKPFLNTWELVQLIVCIEATIPFRKKDQYGKNALDYLHERLQELCTHLNLKVSKKEIKSALYRCVILSINDVSGFFSTDFGLFLSQTWHLILENNPIFRNTMYSIKQYRLAIQRNIAFLSGLNEDIIIHQFDGFPNIREFSIKQRQIKLNLTNAIHYLQIKLVAVTVLEVLADLSGGSAPYLLFIGEERELPQFTRAPIEKFLPSISRHEPDYSHKNIIVHEILKFGRSRPAGFDFKHSPVGAFLYENMSPKEISESITMTNSLHEGNFDRKDFLLYFPSEILTPIIDGVAEMSWSRKKALLDLRDLVENHTV